MEVPNDRDIWLAFALHFTSYQRLSGRLSSARHVQQPVIDGQIRNDRAVHLSQSTSTSETFHNNDSNDVTGRTLSCLHILIVFNRECNTYFLPVIYYKVML